jgi:hypothetical protein
VRNGPTVDIYVKMLHFRGSFQAPVLSNAAIATLSNFPGYPVNDLVLTNSPPNNANKTVDIKVTQGSEQIDSIRILTLGEGGQLVASVTFAATGSALNKTITVADKGRYFFQAVPVAKIGTGVYKAGSPTLSVGPVDIGLSTSDTVYVTYTGGACPGADGGQSPAGKPYCVLDSALKVVGAKNGGTIIINPSTTPMVDVTIDTILAPGSGGITIASGHFDETRPVFLGATKEALTIARKNITLRGFTFEQPAGATKAAVAVNAGGCLIDANIFRAHSKGSVDAPAIKVSIGSTADSRIINNVVWGFAKAVQLSGTSSPNLKIMFNTFVADSALNKTATSGISTVTPDSVSAVIADNFFSGLSDPIDGTLAGKTPILDHNVYTAGASLHGLSESGGLGASTAVGTKDIWVAKYTAEIEKALLATVDCSSLNPCNPLYGGSSDNNYSVTVVTDVFGKARKNRKEVGAYEYPSGPSSVLGVVEIHPTLIPGTFRQILFTVSGKSFDPDKDETDSVQVFWTTSDVTHSVEASLSVIPANQRKTYPISKLVAGNITDTANGIDKESTKYWFFAALSRNTSGRVMGYAYSDTVISNANLLYDSCTFKDSKSACPSEVGIFGVKDGPWAGRFETRVLLSQPTESGLVKVPKFVTATNTSLYNLDLTSPVPMFSLDASVPGLGTDTSKQELTWEVQLYFTPEVLAGLDLFLLPKDSAGSATLVPDSIVSLGGGKYSINFKSTVNGPQTYAFGKLLTAPGIVMQSDTDPPLYDSISPGIPWNTRFRSRSKAPDSRRAIPCS